MKYEERVVAFIDILGFKNIVDKTVDEDGIENEKKIDEILEAFQVHRYQVPIPHFPHKSAKYGCFNRFSENRVPVKKSTFSTFL